MRRGFTLVELVVTLAIAGVVAALALPRLAGILDLLAADAAARDVTTALSVTRGVAVANGQRSRLLIGPDSLRIDLWGQSGWEPYRRWPGPEERGVNLRVSNPTIVFGPTGIGWGASNTTVTLSRGSRIEKITTSRVGRVKRW
ncbi:MAG: prepilin-type N-terminal cleavage/methylation domain-containing protein [Gemmatimonadetes bacterium]|nr:prepilin-type N-terminal cleavage/methylation domain-containing protein [Gemmatimonadota bacterium]